MTTLSPDGTIDVTNLVETMKETWIITSRELIMTSILAIPGLGIFLTWCVRAFGAQVIEWILRALADSALMLAFFGNTALRKASQAGDYVATVNHKNSLPETATDAEYEAAERMEIDAFNRFVAVTS